MKFDLDFDPRHGSPVEVAAGILRVTAGNQGPFTFRGTNTYLIGRSSLAVVDPGPDDGAHLRALLAAIGGRPVSHIFVTHTHRDHSSLAARLKQETGAMTCAEGPHRPARPARRSGGLEASVDRDFSPDIRMADEEAVIGADWVIAAVHTPGHTANHTAFSLRGTGVLFSGDHVMGWSSTIVAPPDGAMADYVASLDKLIEREESLYMPGHGGPIASAQEFVRGLRAHRLERERAILARIAAGDSTIPAIVRAVYHDTPASLHGAAELSVLAQVQALVEAGVVAANGEPELDTTFHLA